MCIGKEYVSCFSAQCCSLFSEEEQNSKLKGGSLQWLHWSGESTSPPMPWHFVTFWADPPTSLCRAFFQGSRKFSTDTKQDWRASILSCSFRSTLFTSAQNASGDLRAPSVGVHRQKRERITEDASLANTSLTHGHFNPVSTSIHGLNLLSLERFLLVSCVCCPVLLKILFLWSNHTRHRDSAAEVTALRSAEVSMTDSQRKQKN